MLLVGTSDKLVKIKMYEKSFVKYAEEKFGEKIIDILVIDYQNEEDGLALLFKNETNKVTKYKFNSQEGSCVGYTECNLNNFSLSKGPRIQCLTINETVADNIGSVIIAVINNSTEKDENQKKQGEVILYDVKMLNNN